MARMSKDARDKELAGTIGLGPGEGRGERMLTVEQVARYLQLNRLTVYRYVRTGVLPASRIGKVYRIRLDDVERFLEARKVGAAARPAGSAAAGERTGRAPAAVRRVHVAEEDVAVASPRVDPPAGRERWTLDDDPLEVVLRGLH